MTITLAVPVTSITIEDRTQTNTFTFSSCTTLNADNQIACTNDSTKSENPLTTAGDYLLKTVSASISDNPLKIELTQLFENKVTIKADVNIGTINTSFSFQTVNTESEEAQVILILPGSEGLEGTIPEIYILEVI